MCPLACLLVRHPCAHRPEFPPRFLRSTAWNRRGTAIPCSGADHRCGGALIAGHSCRGGRSFSRREPPCTACVLCASSQRTFSRLWPSLCYPRWPQGYCTFWGASRCIPRWGARHIRPSSSRQPFCFQRCAEGARVGSRTCRIDLRAGPCPDRRPPSGSQGGGCRCRCRGADTGLRTGSSAARSRSRT